MKIAVIGSGNVGGTLGSRWAKCGHEVIFGVRDPESEKVKNLLASAGENASATSISEAAQSAEIFVLATPWEVTQTAIETAGDLTNKIIIDCTNPLAPQLAGLSIGRDTSAGEQVAQWAKNAKVVKAFNTTGWENMANSNYGDQSITMFICGDDPEAKNTVAKLAEDIGFDACQTGPLYHARYLEPMAMLWIDMCIKQGAGRDFAFKVIRR